MKILIRIIKVTFLTIIILWGVKFASPSLRIDGYFGLISYSLLPSDTQYSEKYTDKKFLRIKKGMTKEEVLNILGEPITIWIPKENYISFSYSESKSDTNYSLRQIYFSEGKVKEIIGYFYLD